MVGLVLVWLGWLGLNIVWAYTLNGCSHCMSVETGRGSPVGRRRSSRRIRPESNKELRQNRIQSENP